MRPPLDSADPEVRGGFFRSGVRSPTPLIVEFIDANRHRWAVEPICTVLTGQADIPISPGTYYAHKKRPPSPRSLRDAWLKEEIMGIHTDEKTRVYGIRKIWAQLNRQGIRVARCTVERLCRQLGICGVVRRRAHLRTTIPGDPLGRPTDLVERQFTAEAPNSVKPRVLLRVEGSFEGQAVGR